MRHGEAETDCRSMASFFYMADVIMNKFLKHIDRLNLK